MAKNYSVYVPAGDTLEMVTDALSSGYYQQIADAGSAPNAVVAIAESADVTIGPFNDSRSYRMSLYKGDSLTTTQVASGVVTAADDAALALKAPKASPTFTGTVVLPSTTSIDTVSATEISYLDGVTSAIQTQLTAKQPILATLNNGTVGTGCTVVESGDGHQHTSVITVGGVLPAITGGADQAVGKLLYTFPAGAIVIDKAKMSVGITQTQAHINADTPDVGLGVAIGTGAVAVIDTFEEILTGQTATNCTGTATVKTVANQIFVMESGDAHTVHLNAAFGWAASGDAAAALSGTVVLHWQIMA